MLRRCLLALLVAAVYTTAAVGPCSSGELSTEVRAAAKAATPPVARVGPYHACPCHHGVPASPVARLAPHLAGSAALAAASTPARAAGPGPPGRLPRAPADLPEPVPLVA